MILHIKEFDNAKVTLVFFPSLIFIDALPPKCPPSCFALVVHPVRVFKAHPQPGAMVQAHPQPGPPQPLGAPCAQVSSVVLPRSHRLALISLLHSSITCLTQLHLTLRSACAHTSLLDDPEGEVGVNSGSFRVRVRRPHPRHRSRAGSHPGDPSVSRPENKGAIR